MAMVARIPTVHGTDEHQIRYKERCSHFSRRPYFRNRSLCRSASDTCRGATGLADTNYEGKARAAIDALRSGADFVFLHIEASDEAGHEGDIELKKRTIEYLDRRIVAPIMEAADTLDEPLSIAVLPDHPTPMPSAHAYI